MLPLFRNHKASIVKIYFFISICLHVSLFISAIVGNFSLFSLCFLYQKSIVTNAVVNRYGNKCE